jgi:hypothetical protein
LNAEIRKWRFHFIQPLNPEREIAFALDAVETVHTVVGRR